MQARLSSLAYWEPPFGRIATKIGEALREHYEVPQELPVQLARLVEVLEKADGKLELTRPEGRARR
jgi:hypothetical protein